MRSRKGLTLLEVIFSMVVLLVGLVAIVFLIPLAGREAEDSQQITQGLAAGESALAMFSTKNVAQPTFESPWCLVDDIGSVEHRADSMREAYQSSSTMMTSIHPPMLRRNSVDVAINQNRIAGIGFCIDPLFWGYQPSLGNQIPGPFFRTRFPYLFDHTDPVSMTASMVNTPGSPRLIRGSLVSPFATPPGSWLHQPAAIGLSTMYGADLVQASSAKNKAVGPLRSVYVVDGSIVSTTKVAQQPSWLVTITPNENNPPITLEQAEDSVKKYGLTPFANFPAEIPKLYDVALVVFAKRDANEINAVALLPGAAPALTSIPKGETVFNVIEISDDAINSGTFNITIHGLAGTEEDIKAGNWLMMSRFTFEDILPRIETELSGRPSRYYKRQIHRWYRVIGVSNGPDGMRVLRISGKPWGWTEKECEMIRAYPLNGSNSFPPTKPPRMRNLNGTVFPVFPFNLELTDPNLDPRYRFPPVIQAVIMKDVVQVYERQMELR